ncbi:UNVERIFIED_CONTAM: ribosomal protein L24E [Brevibacillus sp. OAP136]
MKPIGIILDWAIIEGALKGKSNYENLMYYVESGRRLGMEPIFFHPRLVNFATGTVRGYVWQNNRLTPKRVPIPPVMHNRVLSGQAIVRNGIKRLSKHGKLFNGIVVRNKEAVHRMLWKNAQLQRYLPHTVSFTRQAFIDMLGKYRVLYVKPVVGSVGIGVARIERDGDRYRFTSSKIRKVLTKPELIAETMRWVKGRRFIIQEAIALAKYKGQTFDLRVSVQKGESRQWGVSGMVCKVANSQNKLSNLSRGGQAEPIDEVFATLFTKEQAEHVKERIRMAAIAIAKQYERNFRSLADLGMDMGVDLHGNPYLIEVNVRDQRYSFFKAGELEMFKRTYHTPMAYARTFY